MNYSRRHWIALAAAAAAAPLGAEKPAMIVRSARPEDREMPLDGFLDWITPADRFFVRSHHYTPKVELADWRLTIGGEVKSPLSLAMDELKKMPRTEMVSVLECAGNGRGLYEPSVPGLQWQYGAVANGRWSGVRLKDVLERAGLKESAQVVLFDGADVPVGTMPEFQRTVPVAKCLHPDTMLAYELNGAPLPVANGFPLRLVAPGWAGDSWVKWLTRIEVRDREFDGFFMKTAYRHPGRAVAPGTAVDPAKMSPVTNLAVKSVIATPVEGALVTGAVKVRGAAWSSAPVAGVEVSTDRGRTWQAAKLGKDQARYGWRLWEFDWKPKTDGYQTLMARAQDAAGRRQPMAQEWNPSGYLYNVAHQVNVFAGGEAPAAAGSPAMFSGEAPAAYQRTCLTCHEADVISQQRLTRAQWDREITKMTNWGAPVKPESRGEILDFLSRYFGPRR